mmetsp:Transcript_111555/g.315862  ORF Transcript_111555/g.315862 Transcript_111555/m.315862 type:complete len:220 (-) Transcript_111555:26-685(-)
MAGLLRGGLGAGGLRAHLAPRQVQRRVDPEHALVAPVVLPPDPAPVPVLPRSARLAIHEPLVARPPLTRGEVPGAVGLGRQDGGGDVAQARVGEGVLHSPHEERRAHVDHGEGRQQRDECRLRDHPDDEANLLGAARGARPHGGADSKLGVQHAGAELVLPPGRQHHLALAAAVILLQRRRRRAGLLAGLVGELPGAAVAEAPIAGADRGQAHVAAALT